MDKKILVLEDERPLLAAIEKKLQLNGYTVVSAQSVDVALEKLTDSNAVDVIWIDHYLLGKQSGLDFVAKVKNTDGWKDIPLFVVSNTASPDKVQSYLQLGVTQYYTKSDNRLEDIITEINRCLEERT